MSWGCRMQHQHEATVWIHVPALEAKCGSSLSHISNVTQDSDNSTHHGGQKCGHQQPSINGHAGPSVLVNIEHSQDTAEGPGSTVAGGTA